jgi:hypothetical protein
MGFLMKFRRTVLSVSISAAIATCTACGGGGGGGGTQGYVNNQVPVQPSPSPTVSSTVPYHTPTRVGEVTPINGTGPLYDSSSMYSQNLDATGGQELVVAGRMTPNGGTYHTYNLSVFGWSNGQLVNRTSQWFAGTDNVISGTEPSVKFGDINGDGKVDMYVAPHTDTFIRGPGSIFFNNGTSFTRLDIDLGSIAGHDSAVYDLNRDGYADILTLSYGFDIRATFGSANNTVTTYINRNTSVNGGSGVAIADFMGNGTSSILITDSGGANRLFTWSLDGNGFRLSQQSVMPTQRFLLPKWAGYNFTGSHDVRALAFDFDNSGRTSAVIFSRPWMDANGNWPQYSEIQFLKNQGGGNFVDVTDTTLIGYDHTIGVSYNPTLSDVNNDGLVDIVLTGSMWESNRGPQVLIHTTEHKYVASYATVLKAFQDQALDLEKAINASAFTGANGIVFVEGPNGKMYLATAVSYTNANNVRQKAIYISELGTNSPNVQATVASIRQQWPWMSDAQVNTVLAQSSTTWFGLNMLDPTKALNPIGALSLPVNGRLTSLSGYIGGINLNGMANRINVVDSIGRNFTVNYSSTNTPGIMNLWSRFVENIDDDTRGAQISGVQTFNYRGLKFGGTEDNRNMVVGVTGIELAKDTSLSVQYTRMPFSPFVQLNGSWGLVKSSSTMESTITNRQGGFVSKLGLMYSSTEIDSGLVNRVNPISSVWAETGYEWKNFRAYAGMLPKVISGTADITLPTGIDNRGQIQYTNTKADVYGPAVQYARFNYADRINRYANYRINAMVTTQKYHAVMGEVRINF